MPSPSTTSGGPPASTRRATTTFEYRPHVDADDVGGPHRGHPGGRRRASAPETIGRRALAVHDRLLLRRAAVVRDPDARARPRRRDRLLRLARRRRGRNDPPAPVDVGAPDGGRRAGVFGGADAGHPARRRSPTFDAALTSAGVDHRLVTYPGAPHSFFDRKAADFADASAAAWDEVLGVHPGQRTPGQVQPTARGRGRQLQRPANRLAVVEAGYETGVRRDGSRSGWRPGPSGPGDDPRAGVARLDDQDPAGQVRGRPPRRRTPPRSG